MISADVSIINKLGLHARAASRLVNCASGFAADIEIVRGTRSVNAKSIMGVLTLAAAQSALLAAQDHQLKHRHTRGLVQILPPLQLMETMLFELLWVGEILLSIAILSGFVFLDDIFAQQLVHKTVLTLGAWLLIAVLLWGHYALGWRSKTAVRLTLSGFALLVLAFFGTKLVLELILQRP